MLGYVYVMSNEAMPGVYKIGCTSRHPYERASDLYTTGVPKPFVVEYFININNYENIEKLVHKKLSAYNFGKEFFKYDLDKCILAIREIADKASPYSEAYRDQLLKARVEGREAQYLRELEEKRRREQIARLERERRERQEAEAARIESERREKERVERDRQRREKENAGCLWLGGIILAGLWVATEEGSFWPLIISVFIGFLVNNNITKDDNSTNTTYKSTTKTDNSTSATYSRNIINCEELYKSTTNSKNVINWEEFYKKRDENRH